MPNPFEALTTRLEYDEWGGAFACQERGCYLVVSVAKYINAERLLTWICPEGHISKMEEVEE